MFRWCQGENKSLLTLIKNNRPSDGWIIRQQRKMNWWMSRCQSRWTFRLEEDDRRMINKAIVWFVCKSSCTNTTDLWVMLCVHAVLLRDRCVVYSALLLTNVRWRCRMYIHRSIHVCMCIFKTCVFTDQFFRSQREGRKREEKEIK